MFEKIKQAIGIGSAVAVATMTPGISEGKIRGESDYVQENTVAQSIDSALYTERAMALDDVINEKFRQKILEIGIERIQVLIGKETGEDRGSFQINFGNFVSEDGREVFDVVHTLVIEVDGMILLNKYASEELLSGVIAKELEVLAKRSPKELD